MDPQEEGVTHPGQIHTSWKNSKKKKAQPSDSDRREIPEPQTTEISDQTGHSRDATAIATAFEPLNRSLETFLTRLSRTSERCEKPRRVYKKSRCYKDESDVCIDTWIEHMKLQDLTERRESSALASSLEGTALNFVMAK